MHFLYLVFIMLYTEDFSMRLYVGFSQIGSHLLATSMDQWHMCLIMLKVEQWHMCLIMLKVEQSAFTRASLPSLSDIHECLADLHQMATSSLGKQIAICDSPHDWLMSLDMDLAALCDK